MAKSKTALAQHLQLYRWAVQHPAGDVDFFKRCSAAYSEYEPLLLREDFCGTAAVAVEWVASDSNCQATGVDHDEATLRLGWKHAEQILGPRLEDLNLVHADVMDNTGPKVDVITALNFSVFEIHERKKLVAYFKHCRKSLRPGGIFVMDAYGGPGAWQTSLQKREVTPGEEAEIEAFEYQWEQASCDLATGRVECRIHFVMASGKEIRNAFVYHWRLWTLPELKEAMIEAGFAAADVWCDAFDEESGESDGKYERVESLPTREDFVAYVVGVR